MSRQSGDETRPHLCMFIVSTTWALACAEMVQQCPGMARQVEARLLVSRVAYKMTIDHSSRQPVFFPLRSLVDRCCVCPYRTSSYKSFLWVSNTSAYRGQFGWASMLQNSLSVADLRRRAVEPEEQYCWCHGGLCRLHTT